MTQKIEVDLEEIRQITSWLAAGDIGSIEVSRPGVTIRLKIDDRRYHEHGVSSQPSGAASVAGTGGVQHVARAQAVGVTASTAGVFLASHPSRATPFVEPGARVAQDDVMGLLQIAHLCVPVVAPVAGVTTQPFVAHGETVGYGTRLFEISPTA